MGGIFMWLIGSKVSRTIGIITAVTLLASAIFMAGKMSERKSWKLKLQQSSIETLRKRVESDDKIDRMPYNARRSELGKWVSGD